MKNEKLLHILTEIGLSEDEASVYLSTLSLGTTSVLRISQATNIKRTTVYGIIDSLKEKGLMRVELKGLKQFYAAENPERLEIMLERRKSDFTKNLPEFMALYKLEGGESVMKYYTGIPAMQEVYRNMLKELKPRDFYFVIANQENWYNLDPKFALAHMEERSKKNIVSKLLFQDSPTAREHHKLQRNYNQEVRLLPLGTSLNVDTVLVPTKFITLELTPPYRTIVIENKSIIELHKEMFEIMWDAIGKPKE